MVRIILILIMLICALYTIVYAHMKKGEYNDLREWRKTLDPGDIVRVQGRVGKYEIKYIQEPYTRHSVVRIRLHETLYACITTSLMHIYPVEDE